MFRQFKEKNKNLLRLKLKGQMTQKIIFSILFGLVIK